METQAGKTTPPALANLPWYLSPYLHLILNGLLVTASELLFKRGAMATAQIAAPAWLSWFGFTALKSWWLWGGVACAIASFINWLHVLRWIPLSIAFPIASVVHVLIPLGPWTFWERQSARADGLGLG